MGDYTKNNYRGLPAHFCSRDRCLPVGSIRFADGSELKSASGLAGGPDVGLFKPNVQSPALQKVQVEAATFNKVDRLVTLGLRFTAVVKDSSVDKFKVQVAVPKLPKGFSKHSCLSGQAQVLLVGDLPEMQYVATVKSVEGSAKVELSAFAIQPNLPASQQMFDLQLTYVL